MPTDNIEQTLAGPVSAMIKAQWIFLAQPFSATGDYMRHIGARRYGDPNSFDIEYPYGGDALTASVHNTVPHAIIVELGHAGFHLPERVRNWRHRNKQGRGYFVIPFRHFIPATASSTGRAARAAMPEEIYERAKNLGRESLRGLGDLYKQSKSYVYYRATHPNFPQHLRDPGYTWRASKYEGMVRTPQATPNINQGVYQTFRTVSEDSQGWYIPPFPGRHLARQTAERVGPMIAPLIAEAAQRDLVAGITTVLSGAGFQIRIN